MIANDITIQRSLMTWIEAIDYVFVLLLNPFFHLTVVKRLNWTSFRTRKKTRGFVKNVL